MDAPFVKGEENTLLDILENNDSKTDSKLIDESLSKEIKSSLSTLSEREQNMLTLFLD
jgi:RNA polymerase primary sigma factor